MNFPKSIRKDFTTYYKALMTDQFIYYVCYAEGDENGAVIMFRHDGGIVSDNFFAYVGMMEDIERKSYTWTSRTMKQNIKSINDN